MPKNPLRPFNRRKSSGNILEVAANEPSPVTGTSTFRVLERPEKSGFHGGAKGLDKPPVKRPFNSPLHASRGRSAEELGSTLNKWVASESKREESNVLSGNRESRQTTVSNSGSSGYYDSSATSARHSSSSTIPSSFDAELEPPDDNIFLVRPKSAPMRKPTPENVTVAPLPPPPSFSARAAKALSFASRHSEKESSAPAVPIAVPALPSNHTGPRGPERSYSPQRDRAMTTSSYASTARPEAGFAIGSADFGGDFSSMFESAPNSLSDRPLPPSPPRIGRTGFHRTDSPPIFPPPAFSRQSQSRSPNFLKNVDPSDSPYSFEGTDAYEALLSELRQPSPGADEPPAVPVHGSGFAPGIIGGQKQGYSRVSTSPELGGGLSQTHSREHGNDQGKGLGLGYQNRQTQLDDGDRWIKRVELHDPQEPSIAPARPNQKPGTVKTIAGRINESNARPARNTAYGDATGPESQDRVGPLLSSESRNSTPRAVGLRTIRPEEDSLFDSSPTGSPSRAIRPAPAQMRNPQNVIRKTMTKAEFEQLQRSGENSANHSDEDEYEDDDDGDRSRQMAKQRQKQEANMSVYRQQMKKVTGGGPSDLPSAIRPSLDRTARSSSAGPGLSSLHLGGIGGTPPPDAAHGKYDDTDDDDDVPLGILQAHGFPSSARPPTRAGENDIGDQRRSSGPGSVVGGGGGQGNLPPFARRLPMDPYYGSSVINPSTRESLGMGSAGGSVYCGGLPTMASMPSLGHPGGLVGVIAGEERAKAARRGSPNPNTGAYGPVPLPSNMPHAMGGMPGMGARATSMGNLLAPQAYPGGPPMMPGMPMPQFPGMPMGQLPPMNNEQMQQYMAMQMQFMQNMFAMQQQQMGMPPQGPTQDFGGLVNPSFQGTNGAPSIAPSQGRSMTMLGPPNGWDMPLNGARPRSALPQHASTPSFANLTLSGGPGPGYTPSIAPTERSNVGMASRYRPVTSNGDGHTRTHSMTSATLTAPPPTDSRKSTPDFLRAASGGLQPPASSTIRVVDKPKGMPRSTSAYYMNGSADKDAEDDDEGWADMQRKRATRFSKFKLGKKPAATAERDEVPLEELYPIMD